MSTEGALQPTPRSLRWPDAHRTFQVVAHLTAREYHIRYQSAFLGWLWALAPAVVRFTVLGVVFSAILPDPGPDYLSELAVGVLGWGWFAAGVASATSSAINRSHLLANPTLSRQSVPLVSVLTDAFDYTAGLPALLIVVAVDSGGLPVTALLFPFLLLLEGCLILGIGMAASVANVRWRDTQLTVALILSIGIYVTPVFYTSRVLTEELQGLVAWNPMARLLEAQRDVLVHGTMPSASSLFVLVVVCGGALAVGWTLHRRYSATFLDHL
jgi:lipopolysaccharide transport system permease protein